MNPVKFRITTRLQIENYVRNEHTSCIRVHDGLMLILCAESHRIETKKSGMNCREETVTWKLSISLFFIEGNKKY